MVGQSLEAPVSEGSLISLATSTRGAEETRNEAFSVSEDKRLLTDHTGSRLEGSAGVGDTNRFFLAGATVTPAS